MKQILEYIISKSSKRYVIKANNFNIKDVIKKELDRLGHDANLNHIDTTEVTNMFNLFSCDLQDLGIEYSDINPDISKWNVSKVVDMSWMFSHCEKFNCDISKWDVKNVFDMSYMFFRCSYFNCNISKWDVSSVKDMHSMFKKCIKFNQDISKWDVNKVEKYTDIFDECYIKEEYKPNFNY